MLEFKETIKTDPDEIGPNCEDLSQMTRSDLCERCGLKIRDRFLLQVGSSVWHEDCLTCSLCSSPLAHSCYYRNGKLYCKNDYERIYSVKCGRCGERILPQELIMRASSQVFHLPCFVCAACCCPLQKGDQFILRGTQIFCRADFEKEMYLLQQSNSPRGSDDLISDENSRPRDGRRGPKRPRTILTSSQRRQFKASFEMSPKPCRKVREALAKETGLSVRVVQVWFQNQRAKMKKIQRKAKVDGSESKSDKESKDDKTHKSDSSSSDPNYFENTSDDPFTPASSRPLNPNMPYSPEDGYPNSNESFCSSELSLDDSIGLDDSGPEIDNGMDGHSADLLLPPSYTTINPIDKLYLMQNHYFP